MSRTEFSEWRQALAEVPLPDRLKQSFEITIRWYLSFSRRSRVEVNHESARAFINWAQQEKQPQPWQLEQWKEGIRWFFRAAKERKQAEESSTDQALADIRLPPEAPGWKRLFLTVVRRRHYSYRTEQSYLVWIERFARRVGAQEVRRFLDEMATDQRLSARQGNKEPDLQISLSIHSCSLRFLLCQNPTLHVNLRVERPRITDRRRGATWSAIGASRFPPSIERERGAAVRLHPLVGSFNVHRPRSYTPRDRFDEAKSDRRSL